MLQVHVEMKSFKCFNISFNTKACHQKNRYDLCLSLTKNCLTEALDWDHRYLKFIYLFC